MKAIVDYSNVIYICWSVSQNALEENPSLDPLETLNFHVQGKLRSITRNISNYFPSFQGKYIFVEDRPPLRKRNLYSLYKLGRTGGSVNSLGAKEALVQQGHLFCYAEDEEADDALSSLSASIKEPHLLISGDRDIFQLCSNNVKVFNPVTLKFVVKEDIQRAFNITEPRHIPLYKALFGDSSDNVPNVVPRMQRHLLPLVRISDGSLKDLFRLIDLNWSNLSDRCKILFSENKARVEINYALCKLETGCNIIWG